jgi:hypothetical protein
VLSAVVVAGRDDAMSARRLAMVTLRRLQIILLKLAI